MVNVLTTSLRRTALLAALIVMGFCAASGVAQAQKCTCQAITVDVDANVGCTVELFPEAPLCRYTTVKVRPGGHGDITCCNDMAISLVDVNGVRYTFSVTGALFYTGIKLSNTCCVDAALKLGPNGCAAIRITASANPC